MKLTTTVCPLADVYRRLVAMLRSFSGISVGTFSGRQSS